MPRTLSPGDGLGLLQPLVDAELAAGREVRLHVEDNLVRGNPPQGALRVGRGRGEVEAAWDLGPLVAWFPVRGGWRLEDSTTLASLELGQAPDDDRPPTPQPAGRPRIGHAADVPWLQDWGPYAVSPDEELRRAEAPRWAQEDGGSDWWRWHDQRRVVTRDPAAQVLARVQEVLVAVLPVVASGADAATAATALPGWFRDVCAPAWDAPAGRAEHERIAALSGPETRRAGWASRWTAEELVRHLLPAERVWRFHSAAVVDADALDVCVQTPGFSTSLTAFKWLLHACGARECTGPAGPRPA